MLKPMLFRATAVGRTLRGTMSPTEACQAGLLMAVPQPIRKVKPSRSHGVSTPPQAQAASTTDTVSMNPCADSMTQRRSRLSATAPAHSDSSMIGRVVEAWTRAIIWGEASREVIIQEAPTDWISPPKLDAMLASHTARKIGRAQGEVGMAGGVEADWGEALADGSATGGMGLQTVRRGGCCRHARLIRSARQVLATV